MPRDTVVLITIQLAALKVCVIVRFRVVSFAFMLCVALGGAVSLAAGAQVRLKHSERTAKPASSVHPEDLIQTILSLNLCVDGSATYPCPIPLLSDDV